MKIEQLLQREPFGAIIESTLSRFISAYLGAPYLVTWKRAVLLQSVARNCVPSDGELFFCNPYLNILFSQNAGHRVFDFVRDNYLHTPFRYRRLIQRLYVTLATHSRTSSLLTTHILNVQPRLPDSSNLVILGGNNRIRIIDLQKMRTWDILKTGFDPSCMAAELAVRYQPGEWPFPRLLSVGEDETWFESEYVPAVSLNRIVCKNGDTHLVKKALEFLGNWLDLSLTASSANEYATSLIAKINAACRGKGYKGADSGLLWQFIGSACELMEMSWKDAVLYIDLADTHGDFQHGNILVDPTGKIWVVDWEHAGQRQVAYDYLVFALRSRFPSGLSQRIRVALQDPDSVLSQLPTTHEKFQSSFMDSRRRPVIMMIFLFEELLWNLRENANPLFFTTSGALPKLIGELKPSLQCIRSYLR